MPTEVPTLEPTPTTATLKPTSTPTTEAPTSLPILCTYTQNDWVINCTDTNCNNSVFGVTGTNAGCLRDCEFFDIFTQFNNLGLVMGIVQDSGHFWVSCSTSEIMQGFLINATGDPPGPFNFTIFNPIGTETVTSAKIFGGTLASSIMNLQYSRLLLQPNSVAKINSLIYSSTCTLVDQFFLGKTVAQVVTWASLAITSQVDFENWPSRLQNIDRYSILNQALIVYNKAFRNCVNQAEASCFA